MNTQVVYRFILATITIILFGCGGGNGTENNNNTAAVTPVSDRNNWSIEADFGSKLKGIAGFADVNDQEIIVGEKGVIIEGTNGKWLQQNGILETINDVYLYGSDAYWAVGDEGGIYHYDGHRWLKQFSGTDYNLNSVSALNAKNVWAVGDNGTILNFDGQSWRQERSPVNVNLNAIDVIGTTSNGDVPEVWAVGDNGTILRRLANGVWVQESSGTAFNLNDVSIASYDSKTFTPSVFAIGNWGSILYQDGTGWHQALSPTTSNLNSIRVLPDNSAFAVGDNGVVLFYDSEKWQQHKAVVSSNLTKVFNLPWGEYRGAIAISDQGQIVTNRPPPQYTNYSYDIYIYNNTNTSVAMTAPKTDDFSKGGLDAPIWYTVEREKIKNGGEVYTLAPNQSVILHFAKIRNLKRDNQQFAIRYKYEGKEGYIYQQTCVDGRRAACTVGDSDLWVEAQKRISNTQSFNWQGNEWDITGASYVGKEEWGYDDIWSNRICNWLGIDASTLRGRILRYGIQAGLKKVFEKAPSKVIYNYSVTISNSKSLAP